VYVGEQKVPTTGKMRSWNSLPVRKNQSKRSLLYGICLPWKIRSSCQQ